MTTRHAHVKKRHCWFAVAVVGCVLITTQNLFSLRVRTLLEGSRHPISSSSYEPENTDNDYADKKHTDASNELWAINARTATRNASTAEPVKRMHEMEVVTNASRNAALIPMTEAINHQNRSPVVSIQASAPRDILVLTWKHSHHNEIELATSNATDCLSTPASICTESASGNLVRWMDQHNDIANLEDMLKGPGLYFHRNEQQPKASNDVVCRFDENYSSSQHFPHAMQQLYRCWSWWQSHPRKRHILIWNGGRNNPKHLGLFYHGFLRALAEALNVTVMSNYSNPDVVVQPIVPEDLSDGPKYALASVQHAALLRNGIVGFYRLKTGDGRPSCSDVKSNLPRFPRLTILNRKGTRNTMNAKYLAKQLQSRFPQAKKEVPIVLFEGRSFFTQVETMASTDILISPHGAQLTSSIFMPNYCAAALELFPKGYFAPEYFGSLFAAANVTYYYLYLSENNAEEEASEAMATLKGREKHRKQKICPPANKILDATEYLVKQWEQFMLAECNS